MALARFALFFPLLPPTGPYFAKPLLPNLTARITGILMSSTCRAPRLLPRNWILQEKDLGICIVTSDPLLSDKLGNSVLSNLYLCHALNMPHTSPLPHPLFSINHFAYWTVDPHGLGMVFPKVEPKTRLLMQVLYLRGDHRNPKSGVWEASQGRGRRTTEGFFIRVTTVGNGSSFLLAHRQPPKKYAGSLLKVSGWRVEVWAFIHLLGSSSVWVTPEPLFLPF